MKYRTQKLRKVGENSGPILTRLWTKVHTILRICKRPLVLPNAFTDCVSCVVSFRRYSPLSLEDVEEKRTRV